MNIARRCLSFTGWNAKEATPAVRRFSTNMGLSGNGGYKYDQVDQLFRHPLRRPFSWLYRTLKSQPSLWSKWEHNPEAKQLPRSVLIKGYESARGENEDQYDYHFSSIRHRQKATDRFCSPGYEFGQVQISQIEYYTNSFHYDVRKTNAI